MAAEKKGLEDARLAVMADVERVSKDSENGQYRYLSEPALVRAVRRSMIENRLTLTPDGVADIEWQPARKGGAYHWTQSYTLRHADSGESCPIVVRTAGYDMLDKQPGKGMTGALKYALRQAFLVEVGDDPEADVVPPEDIEVTTIEGKDVVSGGVGYRSEQDRRDFLDAVLSSAHPLSEEQINDLCGYMRNTQKQLRWPQDIDHSTLKFRQWFVGFVHGNHTYAKRSCLQWLELWRKG